MSGFVCTCEMRRFGSGPVGYPRAFELGCQKRIVNNAFDFHAFDCESLSISAKANKGVGPDGC